MSNQTTRQLMCPKRGFKIACETPMACAAQCKYADDPVHPNRVEVPVSRTTPEPTVIHYYDAHGNHSLIIEYDGVRYSQEDWRLKRIEEKLDRILTLLVANAAEKEFGNVG